MTPHKVFGLLAAALLMVNIGACSSPQPAPKPTQKLAPQDPNVSPTPRPSKIERPTVNGTLAPAPTQTDWPGITDQLTVHTDEAAIAVAKNYYQALIYANSTWDFGPYAYLSSKDPATNALTDVRRLQADVIDKIYTLSVRPDFQNITLQSLEGDDKLVQWNNPSGEVSFVTPAAKVDRKQVYDTAQISVILRWNNDRWEVIDIAR